MKIESREFLPKQALSVHASTIVFHPQGHPVFAWFEGPREGHANVFIRLYNLNGDGKSILIGDKDMMPRWNPILFEKDGQIYLFEKMGEFCDRWQTLFHNVTKWSNDITFKEIIANTQILPAGLNASVKTKPIFYKDPPNSDLMFCGSSSETMFDWASYVECYRIENDKLIPVYKTNPLSTEKVKYQNPFTGAVSRSLGLIQPTLWIDESDGFPVINAFLRASYGLGYVYHAKTLTWGGDNPFRKWSIPEQITIENPNSSVDVVYYKNRLFMACNPVKTGRLPLVIFELDKDFKIIDHISICDSIQEQTISQEASYPFMIENNGKLHLTYTYGRSRIEHVIISI